MAAKIASVVLCRLYENSHFFGDVLRRLADPVNLPTLIHCTAGKDRTGVAIALLLLTLASLAVGRWVGLLLLLAWAAGAAFLTTRVGEQMSLRAAFGFHRLIPAQAAALNPAWLADYIQPICSWIDAPP